MNLGLDDGIVLPLAWHSRIGYASRRGCDGERNRSESEKRRTTERERVHFLASEIKRNGFRLLLLLHAACRRIMQIAAAAAEREKSVENVFNAELEIP